MKSYLAKIIENKRIAKNIYKLTFTCPQENASGFIAGQFANIKIPDSPDLLLRRPFSLSSIDRKTEIATIIYQTVGKGTQKLAQLLSGTLDILLPLGNGFPVNSGFKNILLVGGGIGIAPLRSVLEQHQADFDAVLGYKSEPYSYYTYFFHRHCKKTFITSEDGSIGQKGLVTDIVKNLDMSAYDAVFTCGPKPMLESLQFYLKRYQKLQVFASLEEHMGCGMGGCAVCVCKIKTGDDYAYKKVCTEGPVFLLKEVDFT